MLFVIFNSELIYEDQNPGTSNLEADATTSLPRHGVPAVGESNPRLVFRKLTISLHLYLQQLFHNL
jgi:hypothetical protein